MSITKRQQQVIDLLQEHSYLSVKKLSELTFTSPSSIRRDLTELQNKNLIKRTHGGASVKNEVNGAPTLTNRMERNTVEKRKIAKLASEHICDGQVIMLDGSSTASFLLPYIAKHKDITLFTNNMITAINAINLGISTHCIGGKSVNNTAVLSGEESYDAVSKIHSDILFFSSHSIDSNGVITDPTKEENYLRSLMLKNTNKSVFLCDSHKFYRRSVYTLTSLKDIDVAIFDTPFKSK